MIVTIDRIISILIITLSAVCCKGRPQEVGNVQKKAGQEQALLFPDVRIPSMIGSEQERASFLAEHYWDNFTDPERKGRSDSSLVSGIGREVVEQQFSNYSGILAMVSNEEAVRSSERLWKRILACERRNPASNVFETISALAEKYLYDVNSPYRNEDAYAPYASGLAGYEGTDEAMKGKYLFDARMCSLNRVGTQANDFRFRDIDGKTGTLYGLDEEYILLFFSNPGCQACKSIIENLKGSLRVTDLLARGQLAVVNMYIDEDLDAWKSYMPIYPDAWYNVYDPDYVIRTDMTYNVRAIPSLYLLDREKKVLLKDAAPEKVFWYLETQLFQ